MQTECLEFALENYSAVGKYGIWGGTTEKERRRMLRTRKLKRTA